MAAGQQEKLPSAVSSLPQHLPGFCLRGRAPLLYALSEQRVHIDFAPGLRRAPGPQLLESLRCVYVFGTMGPAGSKPCSQTRIIRGPLSVSVFM